MKELVYSAKSDSTELLNGALPIEVKNNGEMFVDESQLTQSSRIIITQS